MKKCEHKTLHFEGKWLAYLVCSCGKKWERTVNYIQNTRYTFFRAEDIKMMQKETNAKQ